MHYFYILGSKSNTEIHIHLVCIKKKLLQKVMLEAYYNGMTLSCFQNIYLTEKNIAKW